MKKWLIAAIAILLVIAGGYWLRQQSLIDGCLDSGGRWDYAAGACER
ncbi:MAG TPA: hypothetical protein VJV39_10755 [Dongiaceae bacterium]|nr:hypothetical protein [Dongiaceae bacterium]